jgi:hypothetical protein
MMRLLKYLLLPDESMLLMLVGLLVVLTNIHYSLWGRCRKLPEDMTPVEGLPMPPHSHWFLGHIPQVQPTFYP